MERGAKHRHPSQILKEIRFEYQERERISTEAAQAALSQACGWRDSTWGNLERSTPTTGQAWKDDTYTSDLVEAGVIRKGSKHYDELIAWERIRELAADVSAQEEYLRQVEAESGESKTADADAEPVTSVSPDTSADNEANTGSTSAVPDEHWEEVQRAMMSGPPRAAKSNRNRYLLIGLFGGGLLLVGCAVVLVAGTFVWQQMRLAQHHAVLPTEAVERMIATPLPATEPMERAESPERVAATATPEPATPRPPEATPVPATEAPSERPPATEAEVLAPSDYGTLLYEESFGRDAETWAIWGGSRIQGGELILVPEAGAHPHSDRQYSDFVFEVEFRRAERVPNPELSVFVHYQVPQCPIPNCGIVVSIRPVQRVVTVRKHTASESTRILSDVSAPALDADSWNRLTVIVQRDDYALYINDVYVASFSDATYTAGKFLLWNEGEGAGRGAFGINYVRVYALP